MVMVNSFGYVIVKTKTAGYRNYWLGKPLIAIGCIQLPKKYYGKRIRIKIEVVDFPLENKHGKRKNI